MLAHKHGNYIHSEGRLDYCKVVKVGEEKQIQKVNPPFKTLKLQKTQKWRVGTVDLLLKRKLVGN